VGDFLKANDQDDRYVPRSSAVNTTRAADDRLREVLALDEFHHEGLGAVGVLKPVDRGNVWVIQRGEHFRFALKARQSVSISGERWRQDLDGDAGRERYSDGSVCSTSTRDARVAGMSEAALAAPMSTTAAPITGSAPGNCTFPNNPCATRTST